MWTAFRRTVVVAWGLASGFASSVVLVAAVAGAEPPGGPVPPDAASSDALAAARALFTDALQDEQAGRFEVALGKFERVREVRETASIEFRIASCLEGLGEPAPAYRAYRRARALGGQDPQSADVSRAASERLDALGRHIALLTLVLPDPAAAGLSVRVDDAGFDLAGAGSVPLPPGRHVVNATSPGATPFHAEIVLAEGAQIALTVNLPPERSPSAEPVRATGGRSLARAGWWTIGGGAALVAASAVLLVVRQEDIAALNRACPGGACRPGADATETDLESTRSRALAEGPIAVACGVAGVAAIGVGLYLVLAKHGSAAGVVRLPATPFVAPLAPLVARGGAGLAFVGTFR
jgi:hypothetical protein